MHSQNLETESSPARVVQAVGDCITTSLRLLLLLLRNGPAECSMQSICVATGMEVPGRVLSPSLPEPPRYGKGV